MATFIISAEDHTLGNSLRYVLASQPATDFVGYSIPHPSEHVIHLRLQTKRGVKVQRAVIDACSLLEEICDHIEDTFDKAEQVYLQQQQQNRVKQEGMEAAAASGHRMEEVD